MPLEIEKDPDENVGGYLSFTYPKLPKDLDFEVFRKTDKDWKRLTHWYNDAQDTEGNKRSSKKQYDFHMWKERFVLLQWPRDPKGPPLKLTPRGKDTGNGCELWGATLYDFYRVHRMPDCPNLSTISTGSRLAAWMREIGEIEAAPNQLKQADLEEDPHQIYPFPIGQFIETIEEQVCKGKVGKRMKVDRENFKPILSQDAVYDHGLFDLDKYPDPWPLKPFSTPTMRLQKKFPISFLPKKLVVHDPWKVLEVTSSHQLNFKKEDLKWGSRPDIIRIYNLKMSEEGLKKQNPQHIGKRPKDYKICPVAHLYITPKRRIGKGHHSFVYQTELELPRDMLVEPKMCFQCAAEGVFDWQKNLKTKGREKEKEDDDADRSYRQYYSLMYKDNAPFEDIDRSDPRFMALKFMNIQHRPPFCKHLDRGLFAPPSQKVSVCAKLSIPNDDREHHETHLRHEAVNYMRFPSCMFEHWNGYNVLQPMHDPTPVGAVVPQFYGYYTPDPSNGPKKAGKFMSAILLLEHCGIQIDPAKLSIDHRQECFSLLRRLHYAGFEHNSMYERNILMQYGPLQLSPTQRSSKHLRFRMIDFGRTEQPDAKSAFHSFSQEFQKANENLKLQYF